jgi:hypothetical protein
MELSLLSSSGASQIRQFGSKLALLVAGDVSLRATIT